MTALGKILVIFVFLLSLFWFGLTAVLFNARTAWKAQAESARKTAGENADAVDEIRKQHAVELSSIKAQIDKANQTIDGLKRERDAAQSRADEVTKAAGVAQDDTAKKLPEVVTLQAVVKTLQEQNAAYTVQNKSLGERVDTLAIKAQDALRKQNDADLQARSLSKALDDKTEQMRQITEEKQGAAAAGGVADFRGDVLYAKGDIVVFSGGINAGIRKGMKFTVRRATAPFFVGTLVVNIDPDTNETAGVFTPAAGQIAKGLYVPAKGDTVSP